MPLLPADFIQPEPQIYLRIILDGAFSFAFHILVVCPPNLQAYIPKIRIQKTEQRKTRISEKFGNKKREIQAKRLDFSILWALATR